MERKYQHLEGQKFNQLTVISFSRREKNVDYWLCRCDCGTEKIVGRYELTSGGTKSCGCIRISDLTGQKFDRLTVICFSNINKNGSSCWLCKCDCGEEKIISGRSLTTGHTQSCGCYNKERVHETRFKDLTGQRFERLLVIEFSHKNRHGFACWKCLCDCGKETVVTGCSLKSGGCQSCGCLRDERAVETHTGEKHHRWRGGNSKRQKYSEEWNEELREQIRNRDEFMCRYPDCDDHNIENGRKLSVHHIDGNKQNCEKWNLISLCNSHHLKVEHNPEKWEEVFYAITSDYR